jgi:hypothetical protein
MQKPKTLLYLNTFIKCIKLQTNVSDLIQYGSFHFLTFQILTHANDCKLFKSFNKGAKC